VGTREQETPELKTPHPEKIVIDIPEQETLRFNASVPFGHPQHH
jgi:hypothetical protein